MRKKEYVEKKLLTDVDALCNRCEESLIPPKLKELCPDRKEFYGLMAGFSSGYFSREYFPDGTYYEFDLCEPCLHWLFAQFKLSPLKESTED